MRTPTNLKQTRRLRTSVEDDIEELERELESYRNDDELAKLRLKLTRLEALSEGEMEQTADLDRVQSIDDITPAEIQDDRAIPGERKRVTREVLSFLQSNNGLESEFEPKDVKRILSDIHPEAEDNHRGYMYSQLKSLKNQGYIRKVRRGVYEFTGEPIPVLSPKHEE